jgi:tRNA(Arg) A34 adenosine deaminase TadA
MESAKPVNTATDDTGLMKLALEQAQAAAAANEVPVGAVVVLDGNIIGCGQNRTRRDGVVHAHAEIVAIAAAEQQTRDYRLDNASIYVTVEPCLMCLGAIYQARIRRIVYGAAEPKFGALTSRFELQSHPALRKLKVVPSVLAEECAELLSSFFQQLRIRRENANQ